MATTEAAAPRQPRQGDARLGAGRLGLDGLDRDAAGQKRREQVLLATGPEAQPLGVALQQLQTHAGMQAGRQKLAVDHRRLVLDVHDARALPDLELGQELPLGWTSSPSAVGMGSPCGS